MQCLYMRFRFGSHQARNSGLGGWQAEGGRSTAPRRRDGTAGSGDGMRRRGRCWDVRWTLIIKLKCANFTQGLVHVRNLRKRERLNQHCCLPIASPDQEEPHPRGTDPSVQGTRSHLNMPQLWREDRYMEYGMYSWRAADIDASVRQDASSHPGPKQ